MTPASGEGALGRWQRDLGAWAIPDEILDAVRESPWELPRSQFTNRARRMAGTPGGVSYERARQALNPGGGLLDVGCGAGAASLPLAPLAGRITGVDESGGMLDAFRALAGGVVGHDGANAVRTVLGRWPDVAAAVAPADVVVCHHVLYNVPDLAPFVWALSSHARRRVVVEITARHPMSDLNPLWERLHRLVRPRRPTAQDALAAIQEAGLPAEAEAWSTPASADFGSYDELLRVTGRRLCLPPDRIGELDAALRELGVDPDRPSFGGDRELVTIWWPGTASSTP